MPLGNQTIASFKIGTQNVDRIYRGIEIVFDAAPEVDADVSDYINRVEAADGAALEQTAKDAVDTLVSDLKTAGVWVKRNLIFLPAGPRTLAGAEEQLKGSAVPNFTNYPSGLYSRSSGLSGNGTSAFMDTDYLINTDANLDSSYSILVTEIFGAATEPLLSNDPNEGLPASEDNKILVRRDLVRAQANDTNSITFGTAEPTYICLARDNSSTAEVTIQGSTQTITQTALVQDANDTLLVHKQHQTSIFGESRISYVSAGGFLTQAERADERAAIEAYMTAISGLTGITAIVSPVLGELLDGDQVQDGIAASATETSNYASTNGTISSAVASVTINGSPGALTDVVTTPDEVSLEVAVTDSTSEVRVFDAGTQTVVTPIITATIEPAFATATNGSRVGDLLSDNALEDFNYSSSASGGIKVGFPYIVVTIDGLTASPITGREYDLENYVFSEQSLSGEVYVSDFIDNIRIFQIDEQTLPAGSAPTVLTNPTIPEVPLPGQTITVSNGTYSNSDFAFGGILTVGGAPVNNTGFLDGGTVSYQIPFSMPIGTVIEWQEESASGLTASVQVTVVAADPSTVPEFTIVWNGTDAFVASPAELILEVT